MTFPLTSPSEILRSLITNNDSSLAAILFGRFLRQLLTVRLLTVVCCISHLCASFSAPEKVSRSRAASLVCLLEGTNTMTGFLGECLTID